MIVGFAIGFLCGAFCTFVGILIGCFIKEGMGE